ncbi:hypothetical protein D915_009169 [Fasciola hepatica]|uniref:Uncharacterized protein n=1 Tax=Fasciola hepatica TaxID=6192 RepID=A0A4E0RDM3_FASHE|nr:hypothetical protein D915_009169 [Fasciola hepatica]
MSEGPLCDVCLSRGQFSLCIKVQCTATESVYYCQDEKCLHFIVPMRAVHSQTRLCDTASNTASMSSNSALQMEVELTKTKCLKPPGLSQSLPEIDRSIDSGFRSTPSQLDKLATASHKATCSTESHLIQATDVPKSSVQHLSGHRHPRRLLTYSQYKRYVVYQTRALADSFRLHTIRAAINNSSTRSGMMNFMRTSLLSAGLCISTKTTRSL